MLLHIHVYSKYIGVNSSSKNITDFLASPCLLDPHATAYLLRQPASTVRQAVYDYLVGDCEYWVMDGHKFGADFLVYEGNPDVHHATKLVFIKQGEVEAKERMVMGRLAGICRKQPVIVYCK